MKDIIQINSEQLHRILEIYTRSVEKEFDKLIDNSNKPDNEPSLSRNDVDKLFSEIFKEIKNLKLND